MPRCWRASGSLPGTCCVSCFPAPNPAINPSGAGTQPRHSDASPGVPPSQGGAGGPVPCPGGCSDAHPAAPNTRARGLSAGYQRGSGCTRWVISAARFLVLMGLQRWMEPSLLCRAAIGKGQGKMLLRSPPPPVNPSPGPHPGPGQALFLPGAASLLLFGLVCLLHLLTRRSPAACLTHPTARGTAQLGAWHGPAGSCALTCVVPACRPLPEPTSAAWRSPPPSLLDAEALAWAGRGPHSPPHVLHVPGWVTRAP